MKEVSIGGSETRLWRKQGEGAMRPDYGDGKVRNADEAMEPVYERYRERRQCDQTMEVAGRRGSKVGFWGN